MAHTLGMARAALRIEVTPKDQKGLKKLLAGETVSVEDLDANYLRRSDAEIFAKKP